MGVLISTLQLEIAHAAKFETLVMPGKVIKGHEKVEMDCDKCHAKLKGTEQKKLCLDCHKKISGDLEKKEGFHGLNRVVKSKDCRTCHTEHKGRGARIVNLDREVFNHKETDFPLKGKHERNDCKSCHAKGLKYREAPHDCVKCHKEKEPHRGRLGEKCADCHGEKGWRKVKYDHKKTKFPLIGKHEKVDCDSCHPDQRYKKTPGKCYECHKLNNIHGKRYDNKCETCHSPEGWKKYRYDHKKTQFPLASKHRNVKCHKCHKDNVFKKRKDTSCYACHENDDRHKGVYGKKCKTCHTPKEWREARFDHEKSKFPLKGKHRKVLCGKCHRGPVDKNRKKDCYTCHLVDDPHRGQEGKKCEKCHKEIGWREKIFFDHDITAFPLIGLHAISPCEACHLTGKYKDTPRKCSSCHSSDDSHKKRLGSGCGLCHNPNGWKLWEFDHDKQTKFKLTGAHNGLNCIPCHRRPVDGKVGQVRDCFTCHMDEDIHRERFGKNCSWCHTTRSFKGAEKIKNPFIKDATPLKDKPGRDEGQQTSKESK